MSQTAPSPTPRSTERLPRDVEALRTLAKERRTGSDVQGLARALEALAVATGDPKEEAETLVALAALRLCHLQQPEEAFLSAARAVHLDPANSQLLAPLREAASKAGAQATYREIIAEMLADAPQTARPMLERERG